MHAAVGDEVVGDILCRVNGNGEADAGGGAAGRVDRGINSNHITVRIDKRAPGIAAVDGRVGLNGFVNKSGLAGLHGAAQRADNSCRKRGLEAEGIADGKNFLADLQRAGISEGQGGDMLSLGIDFHQRDIIALVGADKFCRVSGLIAKHDFDGLRAFDHVKVGQDVAAGINHEARAGAFDGHGIHEEIILGGLGEDVGHGRGCLPVDANVDGFIVGQRAALRNRRGTVARHGFDIRGLAGAEARPDPIGAED